MKLLFFSHFIPWPPHGGSLQRNYNLIRQASKHFEVHLLTFTQRKLLPGDDTLREAVDALKQYCHEIVVLPIDTDYSRLRWTWLLATNLFSSHPYSAWRFASAGMRREIRALLEKHRYDLVHIDTIALAGYLPDFGSVPAVLNHHNVESALLLRRAANEKSPLHRWYIGHQGKKLRQYEKDWLSQFALNLSVSSLDIEGLRAINGSAEYTVIANGTDTDYFQPGSVKGSKELVFAGGMTWYPNRDAMTHFCKEIYPRIRMQEPGVCMNIIGSAAPRDVLDCAERDDSIRVHGFVSDIREIIRGSAVYVVPIRVGGGTRLKILDAFACGKSLVSTSVGCEGIAVTPDKDVLIGDTPEQFGDQVVRLLRDADLRRSLENNGRTLVERSYSWDSIGIDLHKAYMRAIDESNS
ncbi:MAG: glycosyltransferase family 4 protein [Candidatus Zixiibacteriota bacterium]